MSGTQELLRACDLVCTVHGTRGGVSVRVELRPKGPHSQVRPLWSERRYPFRSVVLATGGATVAHLSGLRDAIAREIDAWLDVEYR